MIRDARPEDRPAIAAIQIASWRGAYGGFLSDQYLGAPVEHDLGRKWAALTPAPEDILLVTEEAGQVTGFIYVQGNRAPPYIDNLHAAPNRKRGGIGSALMAAAAARLIAAGKSAVTLTVITDNAPAVNFYRKIGGEFGPVQEELLYGEPVRTYPVTWSDLPALARL